jgi:hypothetical protein
MGPLRHSHASFVARTYWLHVQYGMRPDLLSYRCRTCGAASYRRLVERAPDGGMKYGTRFTCSGCSLVFSELSDGVRSKETQARGSTAWWRPDDQLRTRCKLASWPRGGTEHVRDQPSRHPESFHRPLQPQ